MSLNSSERSQRAQQKLDQRRINKLNKLKEELRQLASKRQEALPQNTLLQVRKLFNLTNGEDLGLIARKYCLDFMLAGLIDEKAEVTELGEVFLELSESKQIDFLQNEILKLPKMKTLRKVVTSKYYSSNKELIEMMPEHFFGDLALKTQIASMTNLLSWLR
ncbi:MAG TPA: hypothetical protein DCS93_26320 [Microscillaceae bacterium]|nr:hypothetical protein [Microscillaceae bacterium]